MREGRKRAKLGGIVKANKSGLFPLGNGEPARFRKRRMMPSDLFLREVTPAVIEGMGGLDGEDIFISTLWMVLE